MFAVTLGEAFPLQCIAKKHAYGSYAEWSGTSSSDFQAQFRFIEADGVTP